MKKRIGAFFDLLKQTFGEWNEDRAPQMAAALAYYTIFSLAPLLIISIAIAGAIFGQDQVRDQVLTQLRGMIGEQGASFLQTAIENSRQPGAGVIATVLGAVTLLLGASGVFAQIKTMLRQIWNVPPEPPKTGLKAILSLIREQFLSISMVLGTGFLLLVSLVLSAVTTAISTFIGGAVNAVASIANLITIAVSFGFTTLLFAAIFKFVPGIKIPWKSVVPSALFTSLLFTIGKSLLGLYLGQGAFTSTYGAAGSVIILILWIYYSAQILFFGAEFAQVYARRSGHVPDPTKKPVPPLLPAHVPSSARRARPVAALLPAPKRPYYVVYSVVVSLVSVGMLIASIFRGVGRGLRRS